LRGVKYVRSRSTMIRFRGIPQTRATRVWLRVRASSGGPPFAVSWPVDVVRVGKRLRWLLDESTADQLRRDPKHCWE
jgi:hypothetical protein